jgi:hypothetical protein
MFPDEGLSAALRDASPRAFAAEMFEWMAAVQCCTASAEMLVEQLEQVVWGAADRDVGNDARRDQEADEAEPMGLTTAGGLAVCDGRTCS